MAATRVATKKSSRWNGSASSSGRWRWLAAVPAIGGIGVLLLVLLAAPTAAQPSSVVMDEGRLAVPYGRTPKLDGQIAPGEYAGASRVQFEGAGGTVTVYVGHDTASLHVAFDLPDTTPYPFPSGGGTGPAVQVFLDTGHDQATAPQFDDYRLTVTKGDTAHGDRGDGAGWGILDPGFDWSGAASAWADGWQAEFEISFAKLGITAGTPLTVGLAVANVWTVEGQDVYWPAGGDAYWPDTWGDALSSESYPGEAWTSWYFKADGWADYAPNGMPDFDEKQDKWGGVDPTGFWKWSYCGPVAAANSLWWFDSLFEPDPRPPLPVGTKDDGYPLVLSYGPPETGWDDHYISNTVPLVEDLAVKYFGTDPLVGTHVLKMFEGLQRYLADHGLQDDYYVTLAPAPDLPWIAEEVLRSEDVILLLGFYEETPEGGWRRVGGHYVTVAGVDQVQGMLALSDPYQDRAEATGAGRVRDGTLLPHPPGHADTAVHNDAGNVSHDTYAVVPSPSPGGGFGLEAYAEEAPELYSLFGVNPHPEIPTESYEGGRLVTELEYAIAVSPFAWKAGGWRDYSPSGVPDFDQQQDYWGNGFQWTYCGPVALADALWYLDSRFEPYPWPIPPPANRDYYPLVKAYGPWDDHVPGNVEGQTATWELVDDLAFHLDTDGQDTGSGHTGTHVVDLEAGLRRWLEEREVAADYAVTTTLAPAFQWVAAEVERCEMVILLLGFWQEVPADPPTWQRLGGHYVTVAGIDGASGLIGLSDPWFDRVEAGWPWRGRVLPLGSAHVHPSAPPDPVHNDAAKVSHDIYQAILTASPGGVWGLAGYLPEWGGDIENFLGQNGAEDEPMPLPGQPIWTEVEWALALSPLPEPDLAIAKRMTPTVAVGPGEWLTYTVVYSNQTTAPAYGVILTDLVPTGLISVSMSSTTTFGTPAVVSGTYIIDLGGLGYHEGGTLTITAQMSPSLGSAARVLTNTAEIGCRGPERDLANNRSRVVTRLLVPLYLPAVLRGHVP